MDCVEGVNAHRGSDYCALHPKARQGCLPPVFQGFPVRGLSTIDAQAAKRSKREAERQPAEADSESSASRRGRKLWEEIHTVHYHRCLGLPNMCHILLSSHLISACAINIGPDSQWPLHVIHSAIADLGLM